MNDRPVGHLHANGTDIHFDLSGDKDKPVLVLANSLGTTMDMWRPQLEAFTAHYRVLRFDMRGHGGSAAPPGPYTIGTLGNDVLALADALGIDRFHFCGLSMGGMVGQWLGISAGDRLSKLVLCATTACMPSPQPWLDRIEAVLDGGLGTVADAVIERWFTVAFITAHPAQTARISRMTAGADPAGYAACCQAIADMDFRTRLGEIAVPVLCVAGDGDVATPVQANRAIAQGVANGRLEIIEEAAHLINLEQPEAFTACVTDFLADGRRDQSVR